MKMNLVLKHGRFILLIGLLSFAGALNIKAQQKEQTLHDLNKLLVNTVMTDLFTPPLAARIYTYPNIAFYECIRYDDPAMITLAGKLNGLKSLPALPNNKIDNFTAACVAYTYVAQSLVGSEYKFGDWRKIFTDSILQKNDPEITRLSVNYGKQVADSIIAWIKKDNYLKIKGNGALCYFQRTRGMATYATGLCPGIRTPLEYHQADDITISFAVFAQRKTGLQQIKKINFLQDNDGGVQSCKKPGYRKKSNRPLLG